MNENLKTSLEKYCLNKKNISTILQNSLLFMDLKQKKTELKPKKKKQHKKIHENDTLFWILYIFENSFDVYDMIGRDKYSVEMKDKTKYVELIKENKSEIKQHKIKISELESDLLYSKSMNIKTFFILLVLKKINLIYYTDKLFFEHKSYNNDNTIIIYHDKQNSVFNRIDNTDIENIKSERLIIENISKPIRGISYYKAENIKNICKKLNIGIMKNATKMFTKKELYQKIIGSI